MGFYIVQFLTGFSDAATLFLVAAGLSLIFGVTRVLNMAHGSFYMVGAYIAYFAIALLPHSGFFFWSGIIASALVVGLIGMIIEVFIIRRLYRSHELFTLTATFAMMLVIHDLSIWAFGSTDLIEPMPPGLGGSINIFGIPMPVYNLVLIIASLLILVAIWFILNKTRWGILLRAATEDREILGTLGVNQKWLFASAFFLGSFLAGLGGAIQLPKGGANLLMDMNVLVMAFTVVIIGGMGSVWGAFLASIVIGEIDSFGVLFFPQSTLVMMFLVVIIVLVVRPYGLLGQHNAAMDQKSVKSFGSILRPASRKVRFIGLFLLILVLLFPTVAGRYQLLLFEEIAIFALATMSLYFIMGPGGMMSFGHAMFFGGGAYAVALMIHYAHTPMSLALILAPFWMGLLALIVGWFCVRLSGIYFGMLTIAFAQILWSIVFQWGNITGGSNGILGIWPAKWASNPIIFYYLTIVLSTGGILLLRHLIFTPFGYTMRSCRDSTLRANSIGINVKLHQWLSFFIAGVFAGLAGGLYVLLKGSVFPGYMSFAKSFDLIFNLLLGGIESISGPIIGSAVFVWLEENLSYLNFWRLILGSILIFLILTFPQGIGGYFNSRFENYFSDKNKKTNEK